ncbi:type II toxin-antitoxin system PemK/MazF family toxin [Leifsonia sp. NPDC058248]|uniref:type II toxin-antitoxin system PemK/MazF family toxin n=1 Tax=Leifsonia sp. NPDC058248 TaxID=3346402 RepID=UPI0036D7C556
MTTTYTPRTDGDADPGEIVWTWVPYEERDGRGKDRPVLVVAREATGTVLAVQLTSQEHPGRSDQLSIGTGAWDSKGRSSYVMIDRVFRVHQQGMRREAAALDARRFGAVRTALSARYGWR